MLNPITIVFIIIIALANTFMIYFAGYRYLQSLQLNSYHTKRYFSWVKFSFKTHYRPLLAITLLSMAALLIVNTLFEIYPTIYESGIGLVFYFIFMGVFVFYEILRRKNTPIVYTKRMKRLIAVFISLSLLISILFVFIATQNQKLIYYTKFLLVTTSPLLMPLIVGVTGAITKPFEEMNNARYVRLAKENLDSRPNLIKIAIAGSYGKTSVKNVLSTILSKKYNVLPTPSSYNTPMGLCKVINKDLNENHEVFIAEMGAKMVGDIKYLCSFINPDYGIVTSVGTQHLETFRTKENIFKAKFELVEGVKKDGCIVFNGNDEGAREFYLKTEKSKLLSGFLQEEDENTEDTSAMFLGAKNIRVDKDGSSFELCFLGEMPTEVKTQLLGRHNIENILLAAALAKKLGLTVEQIAEGISELEPVEHRLKLIKNQRGITIIDDSFNASVTGAKAALDVLAKFDAQKIIITPGLIELGNIEKHENFKFGQNIASVADYAILIGATRSQPIRAGLIKSGFSEEKIIIADNRNDAVARLKTIMKAGDTVLFENDLPDNYQEK